LFRNFSHDLTKLKRLNKVEHVAMISLKQLPNKYNIIYPMCDSVAFDPYQHCILINKIYTTLTFLRPVKFRYY